MEIQTNEITINGVVYVEKGKEVKEAEKLEGASYCIVRGQYSGVFAGYITERKEREVIMKKCRMLWYWDGAASVSQIAVDGVAAPKTCKFPMECTIQVLDAIEILPATEKARNSIQGVAIWKI